MQYATDRSRKIKQVYANSNNRSFSIPPFIPDDPEKPHLSSWKRERERREEIKEIIGNMLQYRKEDWTQDKMNN